MDTGLDLVKLRTLVEVRETGSMTAAAAALGYTTGAVSQQMAALERSVRAELFTQVGRRLQLTDAGRLLADHAVGLLSLARQTELALAGLSGGPRAQVLIGVFGTAAALLPRALLRVREHCPGVGLRSRRPRFRRRLPAGPHPAGPGRGAARARQRAVHDGLRSWSSGVQGLRL